VDHRVPRDHVPLTHSIEHSPRLRDLAARDIGREHDVTEEHVPARRLVERGAREVRAPRLGVGLDERGAHEEVGCGEAGLERARMEGRGAEAEVQHSRNGARESGGCLQREGEREGVAEEAGRPRQERAEEEQGLQREARAEVTPHRGGDDERVRARRLDEARVRRQVLRPRRRSTSPRAHREAFEFAAAGEGAGRALVALKWEPGFKPSDRRTRDLTAGGLPPRRPRGGSASTGSSPLGSMLARLASLLHRRA